MHLSAAVLSLVQSLRAESPSPGLAEVRVRVRLVLLRAELLELGTVCFPHARGGERGHGEGRGRVHG